MKKFGSRLAVGIGLCLASPLVAQTVRTGIEAWQKGDFAAAVSAWGPLAARGDSDAQFNLGQAYRLGKGVPLDLAKAQSLFEQAARKGHVDASTNLGILLFQSNNRVAAMRWLRQSAEAGEPRALLLYGTALFNGDGVKPDPIRAYAYVSRAAAQGLPPAKATLADMDDAMPIEQRRAGVALAKAMIATKLAVKAETKVAAKTPPVAPVAVQPVPAPVKIAAAPGIATSGGWRIQLGAFSKRGSAESLFGSLAKGPLAGRQPFYIPVGAMTRLQAGPFGSKADAATACTKLSARGQACFPVPAK